MGSAPEDEEASAMAAAMGFSSFGAQDRPHKKRRYNAAADTVTCAAVAGAAAVPPTTASNATPLGGGAAASTQTSSHDDSNSNTITSTSTSTTDKGVSALQSLPAHLVGLPARPAASGAELSSSSTQQQQHSSWPQKKQHQRHQQQDHGPRKLWYEGYYDSLSNDNPWERLEKAMGLPSKGSWMVAGQARPQTQ
ncbi:hypothetical protein AAL_02832 [Moelleriella libera RCEF 2490]|uniref:Uncharacterized protein n=1 Tax=Moelleriella libera RCEF 2490 TaxID=1081109 RepID=A0A168E163_9HYPO|nr:hypothetical protein AAL_02832 [Moelleriella libera RCEF 2490]